MLKIDSVFVETTMLEAVSKFLVDVFEMEISSSSIEQIELVLDNYRLTLVQKVSIACLPVIFFKSDSLEEIHSLMQRVEFFYFSNDLGTPEAMVRDELSDNQQVSIFAPDGRPWDIFYLNS